MSLSPHFGPAEVTAAKLRELGVIDGKIATIFHGIDISSREVLNHYYAGVSAAVPARRHDAAHQRPVGRTPQKMGCPGEKNHRLADGGGFGALYPTSGQGAG